MATPSHEPHYFPLPWCSHPLLALIVLAPALYLANAEATPTVIASGDKPAALLELYTSQGCSSCPPAERWLSGLRTDPDLWHTFVPVAFHVDYWDELGWRNLYASPLYGQRQRDYARSEGLTQVYTPGFVLHGQEWRAWFDGDKLTLPNGPAIGRLQLELVDPTHAEIRFVPVQSQSADLQYTIALLGFDVHTTIERGENAGKQLRQDFVVLGLQEGRFDHAANDYHAVASLPPVDHPASRYGLAVWVSRAGDPAPLQAAGGWLPSP